VDLPVATYKAAISEIPGTGSGVTGLVVVFVGDDSTVGYAGIVEGLMPDLSAFGCNATNGCGVHIHDGKSCENTTLPGGHYFEAPQTVDPWIEERYSSNANGTANFAGVADIGNTNDLEGRAFVGKRMNLRNNQQYFVECIEGR